MDIISLKRLNAHANATSKDPTSKTASAWIHGLSFLHMKFRGQFKLHYEQKREIGSKLMLLRDKVRW